MFNVIYIGIPPKGGVCSVVPSQGIATVTEFIFTTGRWKDPDGISEFKFLYSLDEGETFLPIPTEKATLATLKYTFGPIFKTINAKLRCQVKSIKGFIAAADVSFLLAKKSSSNSRTELFKLSSQNITSEQ